MDGTDDCLVGWTLPDRADFIALGASSALTFPGRGATNYAQMAQSGDAKSGLALLASMGAPSRSEDAHEAN
jgi:hypothetical protein